MIKLRRKKYQAILDYVILLSLLIAVLVVMGYYIRNSFCGKWKETADIFGRGEIYQPQ